MVDFEIWVALVAGLVATMVMTAMMTGAKAANMTDMPPMPLVVGTMMSGDKKTALGLGAVVHFVVMGTIVFGLVYAGSFDAFDNDAWWVGGLIGLGHGLIVGVMAMPMMPAMHPRMDQQPLAVGAAAGSGTVMTDSAGEVHIAAPGMLGARWGGMTPVGLIMGHVVYGVVLALVYTWLA